MSYRSNKTCVAGHLPASRCAAAHYIRSEAELLANGTRFVYVYIYRCDDGASNIVASPHFTPVALFPITYLRPCLFLPTQIPRTFALVTIARTPHVQFIIVETVEMTSKRR